MFFFNNNKRDFVKEFEGVVRVFQNASEEMNELKTQAEEEYIALSEEVDKVDNVIKRAKKSLEAINSILGVV